MERILARNFSAARDPLSLCKRKPVINFALFDDREENGGFRLPVFIKSQMSLEISRIFAALRTIDTCTMNVSTVSCYDLQILSPE